MIGDINLASNIENTISLLKTVNMYHAAEALNGIIEKSIEESQTRENFMEEILLKEIHGREKRKLEKRLKQASLPEYKTLDQVKSRRASIA